MKLFGAKQSNDGVKVVNGFPFVMGGYVKVTTFILTTKLLLQYYIPTCNLKYIPWLYWTKTAIHRQMYVCMYIVKQKIKVFPISISLHTVYMLLRISGNYETPPEFLHENCENENGPQNSISTSVPGTFVSHLGHVRFAKENISKSMDVLTRVSLFRHHYICLFLPFVVLRQFVYRNYVYFVHNMLATNIFLFFNVLVKVQST
jgi:hypothetical protein